jgi:hypothetical protein
MEGIGGSLVLLLLDTELPGRWAHLQASRHTRVHQKTQSLPPCGDTTACSTLSTSSSILPKRLGIRVFKRALAQQKIRGT